jgi:osmotically-inducible protein OsmY
MSESITKTDAQVQRDVLDELTWDTRVKETDVGVEVSHGVVTLTGTVDSWTARLAAQEAAHRVYGVLDVANDVKVQLPGSRARTDADLAQAIRSALEWDILVPEERIRTTVSDGVVTLEGVVDFWSQYDDAARCVRNLAGVREVKNLLTVAPSRAAVAPETVRRAIERALERHAERAARHVEIGIVDGKVILSGEVSSWTDFKAVEGAARGTHGVRAVANHLRIQG